MYWVSRHAPTATRDAPPTKQAPRMMPLLAIIDDDEVFVELMRAFLESEGYRVVDCGSARDAVAFVRGERPDLVLLDMRMDAPDSGRRIIEALGTARPAVVVCTADALFLRQNVDWLRAGSEAVLAKPFDLDDLLRAIKHALGRRPPAVPP